MGRSIKIDTPWFKDVIKRSRFGSQRQLAIRMGVNNASLSLIFNGKREMSFSQARTFADLLDVSIIEILRRAGFMRHDEGERSVRLAGYIAPDGNAHLEERNKESIAAPSDLHPDAFAIRIQTSRAEDWDGWVLFLEPTVEANRHLIGRLCLVYPKDNGLPMLAFVSSGYRPETFNLSGILSGQPKRLESVSLQKAAPVVLIRTQH